MKTIDHWDKFQVIFNAQIKTKSNPDLKIKTSMIFIAQTNIEYFKLITTKIQIKT